jgi:DNA polymerase III sliding clamp (beta) subunit (PCNA family)
MPNGLRRVYVISCGNHNQITTTTNKEKQFMKISTLKQLVKLKHSASVEEVRYFLRYINIRMIDGRLIATATDGTIMARVDLGLQENGILIQIVESLGELNISSDEIDNLDAQLKSKPMKKCIGVEAINTGNVLTLNMLGNVITLGKESLNCNYPKTDGFFDRSNDLKEQWVKFGFNAELLANLVKALHDKDINQNKHVTFEVSITNPKSSPIKVTISQQDAVLMPIRI